MSDVAVFEETRFTLRRVRAKSALDYDAVLARLEDTVRTLDPNRDPEGATDASAIRARIEALAEPSGFVIIAKIDHGLLRHLGRLGRSVQYAIGNPLVAADITSRALAGALYAPFRIAIFAADGEEGTTIEFDDPADLMGSLGDEAVADIGRKLSERVRLLIQRLV